MDANPDAYNTILVVDDDMDAREGMALRGAGACHAMNVERWSRVKELFHAALEQRRIGRHPALGDRIADEHDFRRRR